MMIAGDTAAINSLPQKVGDTHLQLFSQICKRL
jgi:hypothetical protein